jgi:major membrane immunogen (membrane-anchored lipoprotein)
MAEREKQTGGERPLALLHQFAHDVVDGGDVVGVDGVTDAQHVSQHRRAQKRRPPG